MYVWMVHLSPVSWLHAHTPAMVMMPQLQPCMLGAQPKGSPSPALAQILPLVTQVRMRPNSDGCACVWGHRWMHPLQITLPQTAVPILGSIIGCVMGVSPLPSGLPTYAGSFVMVAATIFVLLEGHKREAQAPEKTQISAVQMPPLAAVVPEAAVLGDAADKGHLQQQDSCWGHAADALPLSKASMAPLHVVGEKSPIQAGHPGAGIGSLAARQASSKQSGGHAWLTLKRWRNIFPWRRQTALIGSQSVSDEEAATLLPTATAAPSA